MKSMTKLFAVAMFSVAVVGASLQVTTSSAEAGPRKATTLTGVGAGSGR